MNTYAQFIIGLIATGNELVLDGIQIDRLSSRLNGYLMSAMDKGPVDVPNIKFRKYAILKNEPGMCPVGLEWFTSFEEEDDYTELCGFVFFDNNGDTAQIGTLTEEEDEEPEENYACFESLKERILAVLRTTDVTSAQAAHISVLVIGEFPEYKDWIRAEFEQEIRRCLDSLRITKKIKINSDRYYSLA